MLTDRLEALRISKGMTKKGVAEYLKIDQSTYGKYELGKREPDYDTLSKIAQLFNTTTDYLLGNSDDPHPPGPTDPEIKDSPIGFMGNMNGINVDELEKVINRAVKKALDERDREKKKGE